MSKGIIVVSTYRLKAIVA